MEAGAIDFWKYNEPPLTVEDFYGTFTGYPFTLNAKLNADDAELEKILEIGWRTARSCAVETNMDCPYYERLQYIGDARIQCFVSLFNSGDDRLFKNALNLMDYSRQRDGYTLSRYPNTQNQVIPTYSLWYVCMLHDYLMYGSDDSFLKDKRLGSRQIMNYFLSYLDADGSLKNVPDRNSTSPETGILRSWPKSGPEVLWTVPVGRGFGGPVIQDGKVYVLDRDDKVGDAFRCYDLSNGKELWNFSIYSSPQAIFYATTLKREKPSGNTTWETDSTRPPVSLAIAFTC